jgi:hypothetical protein
MSSERDTHFQSFARLLWTAIVQSPEWPTINLDEETIQQAETVIAQRAYDLVAHVIDHLDSYTYDTATSGQDLWNAIPDLTEWPKPD